MSRKSRRRMMTGRARSAPGEDSHGRYRQQWNAGARAAGGRRAVGGAFRGFRLPEDGQDGALVPASAASRATSGTVRSQEGR